MKIENGRKPLLLMAVVIWWVMPLIGVPGVLAGQEKAEVFVQLGHTEDIHSLSFSQNGQYFISKGFGEVRLWEVSSGREIRSFQNYADVSFHPDGRRITSSSNDGVDIWDVYSGSKLRSFEGYSGLGGFVAFSSDGSYLAAC